MSRPGAIETALPSVDVHFERQAIDRLAEDELGIALTMDDQFRADAPHVGLVARAVLECQPRQVIHRH